MIRLLQAEGTLRGAYCDRCGRNREPSDLRKVTVDTAAIDGVKLRMCGPCRRILTATRGRLEAAVSERRGNAAGRLLAASRRDRAAGR